MAAVFKLLKVGLRNFDCNMVLLDSLLYRYNVLAVDSEFPGCLCKTPRNAPADQCYNILKFNVDCTNLIQLGITLSDDEGKTGFTFEFNFSDFDVKKDLYVEDSIDFLRSSGLNLEKIQTDGIPKDVFVPRLLEILSKHKENLEWVTFHGLYDIAYVVKMLNEDELPPTAEAFSRVAAMFFERVIDIKVVAEYCEGLRGGKLGLKKLADILNVERQGGAHHAGSDSFLTAAVFAEMKNRYDIKESVFDGFLYGMDMRIMSVPTEIIMFQYLQPMIVHIPFHPTQAQRFSG